ncbi:Hypothetical protein SRAE_0000071500 [Strongyloides ratti]|uniref:Uncharacterized protein n=1 Tax=Strongyloides ratti TaxID=34506 RepID=A0A090MTF0_STRRB|nr:Hypothetical protein SRAE_0000071500 [Strongyloides ratti]CEF61598.1 Hypothetical protein SRAE_0000071500 [Strongyloides ratti]
MQRRIRSTSGHLVSRYQDPLQDGSFIYLLVEARTYFRGFLQEGAGNEPQYNCGFRQLPSRGMSLYGKQESESHWREGENCGSERNIIRQAEEPLWPHASATVVLWKHLQRNEALLRGGRSR